MVVYFAVENIIRQLHFFSNYNTLRQDDAKPFSPKQIDAAVSGLRFPLA